MYEDIVELVDKLGVPFPKQGTGVTQKDVDAAQSKLGILLPESYKWWLFNYGGGQIGGDVVYGLDLQGDGRPDVVELAQINRRDGLCDVERLEICAGNEESFFLDTSKLRDGEYKVLVQDVTVGTDAWLYAESFADFLRRRIREVYE